MPIASNMAHLFKALFKIVSVRVFLIPGDLCDAKEGTVILFRTEKTVLIMVCKVNTELLGSLKCQHISVSMISLLKHEMSKPLLARTNFMLPCNNSGKRFLNDLITTLSNLYWCANDWEFL